MLSTGQTTYRSVVGNYKNTHSGVAEGSFPNLVNPSLAECGRGLAESSPNRRPRFLVVRQVTNGICSNSWCDLLLATFFICDSITNDSWIMYFFKKIKIHEIKIHSFWFRLALSKRGLRLQRTSFCSPAPHLTLQNKVGGEMSKPPASSRLWCVFGQIKQQVDFFKMCVSDAFCVFGPSIRTIRL